MRTKITPIVVIALVLGTFTTAFAQSEEILPCSGENVAGTVIGVEEQTVIVETDGGTLCSVTLSGEFEHPIVELLGNYFGDVNAQSLAEALGTLETNITCEGEACDFAGEGEDGTAARVLSVTDNGDGTWTIEVAVEVDGGEEVIQTIVTDDEAVANMYKEALESLLVEWDLSEGDEGSSVVTAGDEIAAYHDDGYGFGVLVKVYAIAAAANEGCGEEPAAPEEGGEDSACGATVEEIMTLIDEGAGMGQLFKEYGRPSILGIGHVRQLMNEDGNGNDNDNGQGQGVCNARAHGGNANANGRTKDKKNGQAHPNPVQCDPVEGTDPLPEPEPEE